MVTSIDKALVAIIMSILYLINTYTGFEVPFASEGAINALVAFVTPFLVWLVPNKE